MEANESTRQDQGQPVNGLPFQEADLSPLDESRYAAVLQSLGIRSSDNRIEEALARRYGKLPFGEQIARNIASTAAGQALGHNTFDQRPAWVLELEERKKRHSE